MAGKAGTPWFKPPAPKPVRREVGTGRAAPTSVKSVSCPSCGGSVELRYPGKSLAVVCQSCKSVLDATNPDYAVLSRAKTAYDYEPAIPLGRRGTLKGTPFEVIGYVRKSDETGVYEWDEHLLFNPLIGYRWLVLNQGHWSYVVPLSVPVDEDATGADHLDKRYRLFLKGGAQVIGVIGEFYWKIRVGDKTTVADFIRPPEMLSKEQHESEVNWSLGEYILPDDVAKAFDWPAAKTHRVGVAPHQPSPVASRKVGNVALAAFGAMVLIQVVTASVAADDEVVQLTQVQRGATANEYLSDPFELGGRASNVWSRIDSDVDNTWLEIDASLVDANGQAIGYKHLAEAYRGITGGEHWSEGSTYDEVNVPDVPPGVYRLVLEGAAERDVTYTMRLRRDSPLASNFIIMTVLLLIYPLILWLRRNNFEVARWSTSDESPPSGILQ